MNRRGENKIIKIYCICSAVADNMMPIQVKAEDEDMNTTVWRLRYTFSSVCVACFHLINVPHVIDI